MAIYDGATVGMMTSLLVDLELNGGVPKNGPPSWHDKLQAIKKKSKGASKR